MKRWILLLCIILVNNRIFAQSYINGVDLSYVNEMEDCGAVYKDGGVAEDIYSIFSKHNTGVIRYRLWHTPDWTDYSTFSDVYQAITRAKARGFKVLLDFQYSDNWADPGKQERPAAWKGITDMSVLQDSVYNYTFSVLNKLNNAGLMPEFVQIGNETNSNIMLDDGESLSPLNWSRNAPLFQAGINAVHDVSDSSDIKTKVVIHIADPSKASAWFSSANSNGLTDFDIIGLSYYPAWHNVSISGVGSTVASLKSTFTKDVWIVETGYPWTLSGEDAANNIYGSSALVEGYPNPPTPAGQLSFLLDLTYSVISNGGMGIVYWEPAWVSTGCSTQWGTGSHYENCTLFDFNNNLLTGVNFLDFDYENSVPGNSATVTFKVDMTGVDTTEGVFVTGDFTGTSWLFMRMHHQGNMIFKYKTTIPMNDTGAYIFTKKEDWDMATYHEQVHAECALVWGTHRQYLINQPVIEYAYIWGTCDKIVSSKDPIVEKPSLNIYPNPTNSSIFIQSDIEIVYIRIINLTGAIIGEFDMINKNSFQLNISHLSKGLYLIQYKLGNYETFECVKIIKE
ncbi:MAG: glycosyl hydrolase 53 family protein [Bacteroidales bacterium]|nr:glycosyl hydrolase 53 family protein [Bacteroidales bacterium]